MGQTVRFQETLHRLAMIDEGFVTDEAGLGVGLVKTSTLDPKTAALLRVAVLVAIGSPAVSLEWGASRALAAARVRTRSPTCCRCDHAQTTPKWDEEELLNCPLVISVVGGRTGPALQAGGSRGRVP